MPRVSRLDYPGALHHVIARGIERKNIFEVKKDKEEFYSRLNFYLDKSSLQCYAWCIMSNHIHLLLQSGKTSLPEFMSRLLTSYAVYYNRSYKRSGHLFQNRYKSVLCDKDEYLLSLVRYINLNPVKAQIIPMSKLEKYKWTSHRELLKGKNEIIEREEILSYFSSEEKTAKRLYQNFVKEGLRKEENYEGGGLVRSGGGLENIMKRKKQDKESYDARILGRGSFVEKVLKEVGNIEMVKIKSKEMLLRKISSYYGINEEEILGRRQRKTYEAKQLYIYLGKKYLSKSLTELGRDLGIGQSGASMSYCRGEEIDKEKQVGKMILF